jgi:hypothetical protein
MDMDIVKLLSKSTTITPMSMASIFKKKELTKEVKEYILGILIENIYKRTSSSDPKFLKYIHKLSYEFICDNGDIFFDRVKKSFNPLDYDCVFESDTKLDCDHKLINTICDDILDSVSKVTIDDIMFLPITAFSDKDKEIIIESIKNKIIDIKITDDNKVSVKFNNKTYSYKFKDQIYSIEFLLISDFSYMSADLEDL